MKYIVAGNRYQGEVYRMENHLSRSEVHIVGDADSLRGIHIDDSDEVIYYGTFYERPDISEIEFNISIARRHHASR